MRWKTPESTRTKTAWLQVMGLERGGGRDPLPTFRMLSREGLARGPHPLSSCSVQEKEEGRPRGTKAPT